MSIGRLTMLTVIAVLISFAGQTLALDIGDSIVELKTEMQSIEDETVTIEGVKGEKGTLVIFSCVHCPAVKAYNERLAKIGNEYQKKDIGVIFINSNNPAQYPVDGVDGMREQAKRYSYEFPYVIDATSNVARAFGATRTPEAFLFDADGKLVYTGTLDNNMRNANAVDKHYLRDALDAVLAGEEIDTKKTRAVGCTIKFR